MQILCKQKLILDAINHDYNHLTALIQIFLQS